MQETLKILVVRFSSIGDIVLTTPVVRMLKKQLNAQVHYLTKSSYVSLLKNNPYIDSVYQIQNSITEVIADLKKEKYHYVIDLHSNLRTQILKFRLYTVRKDAGNNSKPAQNSLTVKYCFSSMPIANSRLAVLPLFKTTCKNTLNVLVEILDCDSMVRLVLPLSSAGFTAGSGGVECTMAILAYLFAVRFMPRSEAYGHLP